MKKSKPIVFLTCDDPIKLGHNVPKNFCAAHQVSSPCYHWTKPTITYPTWDILGYLEISWDILGYLAIINHWDEPPYVEQKLPFLIHGWKLRYPISRGGSRQFLRPPKSWCPSRCLSATFQVCTARWQPGQPDLRQGARARDGQLGQFSGQVGHFDGFGMLWVWVNTGQ